MTRLFEWTPAKPTKHQAVIDHLLAGNELCGAEAKRRFGFSGLPKLLDMMRADGLHVAVREQPAPRRTDGKDGPNGRSSLWYRLVEDPAEATPPKRTRTEAGDWIVGQLRAGKELTDGEVTKRYGKSHASRLSQIRHRMERDGYTFTSRRDGNSVRWRLVVPGEDGEAPTAAVVPVKRNGKRNGHAVEPYGMPSDAPQLAILAPHLGQILGVYLTHLDDNGEVTIGLRTAGGKYLFKMIGAEPT